MTFSMNLLEESNASVADTTEFIINVIKSIPGTSVMFVEPGSDVRSVIKQVFDTRHTENITFVDIKNYVLVVFIHDAKCLEHDINNVLNKSETLKQAWQNIKRTVK